jgi:hypothetical protein
MKKRMAVFVVLACAAIFAASMLHAQAMVAGEKEKAAQKKEMKLTDEQKAKLEQLRVEQRMATIDLRAEREKLALKLQQEWMKPEPSQQGVESLVKQLSAVREKLMLNAVDHMLAVRKLLGPGWRMHMKGAKGSCCGMMGDEEMPMSCLRESFGMHAAERPGMAPGVGKGRYARRMGRWNGMMFRPFGRRGGFMMERPGAAAGPGAMHGGCIMHEAGSCKKAQSEGMCPGMIKKEIIKKKVEKKETEEKE